MYEKGQISYIARRWREKVNNIARNTARYA
jgi:hypothetical protein